MNTTPTTLKRQTKIVPCRMCGGRGWRMEMRPSPSPHDVFAGRSMTNTVVTCSYCDGTQCLRLSLSRLLTRKAS